MSVAFHFDKQTKQITNKQIHKIMITLGEITDSDLDLIGAISDEELMGALEAASPQQRKAFTRKVKSQPRSATSGGRATSRGELEKRMHLLPKEIQNGIAKKTLQAVDAAFYVTKNVSGNRVVKMMKDDDNKVVGVSNISGGKFEKGNVMLLDGIILIASVGVANAAEGDYKLLPATIRNGEFEFKANGTTLVPLTAMEIFNTTDTRKQIGLYKLDNPKIIYDQQAMELNLEWGANAAQDTIIKAILVGTAITKY